MKIFDAFIFFNEIALLKIRLEMLFDFVDKFYIAESNYTHSGRRKPYNFEAHKKEFYPWLSKIELIKFEPDVSNLDFSRKDTAYNPKSASWILETQQRNSLSQCLVEAGDGDYIIVSDLDEIPSPDALLALRSGQCNLEIARFEMQNHYYYMNCRGIGINNSKWYHPFFSKASYLKRWPDISSIRTQERLPFVKDSGWHFSYLGGIENIERKIESFAHTEVNDVRFNNRDNLARCLDLGIDFLGREGFQYAFFPVNAYPPLLANMMRKNLPFVRTSLI